ncbi:MAG: putative GNAT family N-acyltransferase [Maribacter sp.]|jgi:predicted GNAT family N-acyltransferase
MLTFLEIPFATPLFDESIRLRYDILRKPLGLDFDADDIAEEYRQIHLGAYDDDLKLLACLVLNPQDEHIVKMRQVAVADNLQGKGIGKQLVIESEKLAKEKGFNHMAMNAREAAVPFYLKLGYEKYGRRFTEVTVPHYKMRKDL